MQTRRQAFKNPTEQYQRILDVVTKYSVHFGDQKVSFTCKKQGQPMSDLHTPVNSSSLENIKIAYGASVSRELITFEMSEGLGSVKPDKNMEKKTDRKTDLDILDYDENGKGDGIEDKRDEKGNIIESKGLKGMKGMKGDDFTSKTRKDDEMLLTAAGLNDTLVFSIKGLISNANYSSKRGVCIIFINNRLVECQSIKRVIESVYNEVLPRHTHPFLYLSIRMPPQNLDVNVHPVSTYTYNSYFILYIKILMCEICV